MVLHLRRVLLLLLLAAAPIFDSGSPGPEVTLVTMGEPVVCARAVQPCDGIEMQARMHREVQDRTRIFWVGSGLVLVAVVGGLSLLIRHPRAV
ncbi:MAG TPA: hypothetical protein VN408_05975 [Actinoplanes sp.]|nr:hypothetical protein [Actinoplanes sp.]